MSKTTDWLELQFSTHPERGDWAEQLLTDLGAVAVTVAAASDDEVLEPAVDSHPLWQSICVRGLFAGDRDPLVLTAEVAPRLSDSEGRSLSLNRLADQPWERAWLAHYRPLAFGRESNLRVCPTTESAPPDGHVLRLDPGLAFGTGTHATTAMCLDALADHPPEGKAVLDYGCGSGILAIAASLLGAAAVTAVDNDPQALQATTSNARLNSVAVNTVQAAQFTGGAYDLVIANILANTLVELAPLLTRLVRSGGRLILSGVLDHQAARVRQAYTPAFSDWRFTRCDDWVALMATAAKPVHVHPVP